nr:hypothetical protein [uncultured Carboxylicivirga sp.]
MIIYGTRSFSGKAVQTNNTCPNCNTQGQMVFQSAIRYAHIFWIPLFPFQKIVVGQCQHCKKVYDKKTFDSRMFATADEVKQRQSFSVFHFTGLIIIAAFVVWGMWPESEASRKNREMEKQHQLELLQSKLDHPQVNDIYYAKAGDTLVSGKTYRQSFVLKVINSSADSVGFELSNLLKIDRKLVGNAYASVGEEDDYFAPENIYSNSVKESKERISKKLILDDFVIYQVKRDETN